MEISIHDKNPETEIAESPEQTILRLQEELRQKDLKIDTLTKERDEARKNSIEDDLTGILNRRGGELFGNYALDLAHREGLDVAVIMIDIDHFKEVNDENSHEWGDQTLQGLAREFEAMKRDQDVWSRKGGEEFLMLLPMKKDVALEEVGRAVKRYRERVHALRRNDPQAHPDDDTQLTASFGVAIIRPYDSVTLPMAIKMADDGLYQAKHSGRDTIRIIYADDYQKTDRDKRIWWPASGADFITETGF